MVKYNIEIKMSQLKCLKLLQNLKNFSSQILCFRQKQESGLLLTRVDVINVLLGKMVVPGNTITVLLTSCLTGSELAVWQLTIFVLICKSDLLAPLGVVQLHFAKLQDPYRDPPPLPALPAGKIDSVFSLGRQTRHLL